MGFLLRNPLSRFWGIWLRGKRFPKNFSSDTSRRNEAFSMNVSTPREQDVGFFRVGMVPAICLGAFPKICEQALEDTMLSEGSPSRTKKRGIIFLKVTVTVPTAMLLWFISLRVTVSVSKTWITRATRIILYSKVALSIVRINFKWLPRPFLRRLIWVWPLVRAPYHF